MILSTAFRHGRRQLVGGSSARSAPLSTAIFRPSESQQQRCTNVALSNLLNATSSTPYYYQQPIKLRRSSFHTSVPALQSPKSEPAKKETEDDPNPKEYKALTPSIRAAILADLEAVDFDGNRKIDSKELEALLRKYNESFTEEEVIELGHLFYASMGAEAVPITRVMEMLEAVAADEGTSLAFEGETIPLAEKGKFKTHLGGIGTCASEYMFNKTHGVYSEEDLKIELTHRPPETTSDKSALLAVRIVRVVFDTFSLWNFGKVTKEKILVRAIFLETIAAIPGMVAAIIRHFRSLRNMARDGGMLNMFLEEANNERMHLLTFIKMREPGKFFRFSVLVSQFGFGTFFLTAYMISPQWCHRFVGYVEEEACHTYTKILDEFEKAEEHSDLAEWRDAPAPKIAKGYWHLGEDGTIWDVMKAVRADEAEHRDVNHAVSGVAEGTINPLYNPREKLDDALKRYVRDIMDKEAKKVVKVE